MDYSNFFFIVGTVAYVILIAFTVIRIISDTENSAKSLGYLLMVMFLPVIGVILYFSLGENYRKRKLYKQKLINDQTVLDNIVHHVVASTEELLQKNAELIDGKEGIVRMLLSDYTSPLAPTKEVKLLVNGERKFEELFNALEEAKDHIHMQYYIFCDDVIGNRVKDILLRKAAEGVTVRFMVDDFGSHGLRKRMLKELKNGGVEVAVFYKIHLYALANRMNYRNHRKTVVIDGKTGFVGGINVEDKYINDGRSDLFWRDTHIMVRGAATLGLQYTFMNDWNFCAEQKVKVEPRYFAIEEKENSNANELVQIAASGPDSPYSGIMLSCLGVILNSKKRLYITSPYFIPNETIVDAIKFAALSGVDVRLLVPGISDSKLVNAASCSYYGKLLNAGVRIFRYQKGFVHAKTMVSDHTLVVVGSANMDMRSFDLNFEINALVFSREINNQLCDAFLNDLEDSVEINPLEWANRGRAKRFGGRLARLCSPLL